MGFIPQVICRRCGEKFSGLRRRCPKCGTRRVQNSRRSPGTTPSAIKGTAANQRAADDRKWQLIFGIILIVAVIAALVVMITVSLENADNPNAPSMPTTPPDISAAPTATPTPTPEITSLGIYYGNDERTEFLIHVGDEITLTGSHFPLTIAPDYKWSASDESIISIKANETGGCTVTGVSVGTTKLILTCYGKTAECTVYVTN